MGCVAGDWPGAHDEVETTRNVELLLSLGNCWYFGTCRHIEWTILAGVLGDRKVMVARVAVHCSNFGSGAGHRCGLVDALLGHRVNQQTSNCRSLEIGAIEGRKVGGYTVSEA